MTIILETSRLVLREMSLADLDFVAAMLAEPDRIWHSRFEHIVFSVSRDAGKSA